MSKITENVPLPMAAGALLVGAMLFGASLTYAYGQVSTVAYANACGDRCDAEDPDDCGDECHCVDADDPDERGLCKEDVALPPS